MQQFNALETLSATSHPFSSNGFALLLEKKVENQRRKKKSKSKKRKKSKSKKRKRKKKKKKEKKKERKKKRKKKKKTWRFGSKQQFFRWGLFLIL